MASRAQCVVDIFLETDGTPNKGWQTAPNVPHVVVESASASINGYKRNPPADGVVIVEKEYDFDRERFGDEVENRIWTFTIHIIAASDANLELMIMQAREVCDRYISAPFTTDTNSHTYSRMLLNEGATTAEENSWAFEATLQLTQDFKDIVIA